MTWLDFGGQDHIRCLTQKLSGNYKNAAAKVRDYV